MVKKINFRGKPIEELVAMPLADFLKIIPSKQRRTLTRMSYKLKNFYAHVRAAKAKGKKTLKTQVREAVILPEMVGMEFQVYNGKEWVKVLPTPLMLGHRLGEYSITIKQVKHSGPGIGATRGSKSVELK